MSRDDDWTARWVAEQLNDQAAVTTIRRLSPHLLEIHRSSGPVLVGTLAVPEATLDDVQWVLGQRPGIAFVANVKAGSRFSWEASVYARSSGAAVGGLSDLKDALKLPDPASFLDRETAYREMWLSQHTRVKGFQRLSRIKYLISRNNLPDVTIIFLYHYELSADAVRTAIATHGSFDAIIKMNPNGRISGQARSASLSAGRRILTWSELLGELNKEWPSTY